MKRNGQLCSVSSIGLSLPDGVTPTVQDHYAELGYRSRSADRYPSTPSGIGNVAAQTVMAFRSNDGSNQLGNHVGAYSRLHLD